MKVVDRLGPADVAVVDFPEQLLGVLENARDVAGDVEQLRTAAAGGVQYHLGRTDPSASGPLYSSDDFLVTEESIIHF